MKMNTNKAASSLGVSPSTIQRWVKQFGLEVGRNELGHYHFEEDQLEILKDIQSQIQNGALVHEVKLSVQKTPEVKQQNEDHSVQIKELADKVTQLDSRLDSKADDVVSYQLLQHRREIEDLKTQLLQMAEKVGQLEASSQIAASDQLPVFDHPSIKRSWKKKNIISMLFGF
ncbi:chromosome segregation protein [Bacillus sp. UMB0728]|nr:chromosome segregation protein [Bacillus sp. UMB0728]